MSMMTVTAPEPGHVTYAAAPFDHSKADITLRSSDNVHFRVFRLFLSLASPFFETLFEIPQPSDSDGQEIIDGLVVVPVAEDSKTLDTLLRFCYPCTLAEDPHLKVFEDVIHVLLAAQKYSFDVVEKKICQTLSDPQILEAEPFRCFAIARRAQLQKETLLAARYTLLRPPVPSWFDEISLITAVDLFALLIYRERCGDAVYALRNDGALSRKYRDKTVRHGKGRHSCQCPNILRQNHAPSRSEEPPQWWEDFMTEVFTALRYNPCKATVETVTAKTVQGLKTRACSTCLAHAPEAMRDFSELLVERMDGVVSQIRLGFNLGKAERK